MHGTTTGGRLKNKAAEYEHDAEPRPAAAACHFPRQDGTSENRGMSTLKPVTIDGAFEAEARAMGRAVKTGELPPENTPYYVRVKRMAELHWEARALASRGAGNE